MPCSDSKSWGESENPAPRNNYKKRLDEVSALLCATCRELETQGYLSLFARDIEGLEAWWKEHKEFDAKRPQ